MDIYRTLTEGALYVTLGLFTIVVVTLTAVGIGASILDVFLFLVWAHTGVYIVCGFAALYLVGRIVKNLLF